MPNSATIEIEGTEQVFGLSKKDFSTGSKGFHAQGKLQVGEKKYQINILCVEIGSNPNKKK